MFVLEKVGFKNCLSIGYRMLVASLIYLVMFLKGLHPVVTSLSCQKLFHDVGSYFPPTLPYTLHDNVMIVLLCFNLVP